MLLNENTDDMENNAQTFYSPISKYDYLTPLQRKKLREKRKLTSPEEPDDSQKFNESKTKSVKKLKRSVLKPKLKKEKIVKKPTNENLPEIRCTAAQLINKNKESDTKKNKFFKTRSPEHFNKACFVVPLTYKRPRLDFTDGKHSTPLVTGKNKDRKTDLNNCASLSDKKESNTIAECVTNNPFVVKVNPVCVETITLNSDSNSTDNQISLLNEKCSNVNFTAPDQEILTREDEFTVCESTDEQLSESVSEQNESISSIYSEEKSLNELTPSNTNTKFYPIFYKKIEKQNKPVSSESVLKKSARIKDKFGSEQLIIDAGQKEFGAKQCKTCHMIYSVGDGEDEKLHSKFHDMYLVNLKFPGWKKEHVIGKYEDGRIIKVCEDDKNFKLKKIQDILLIANRDLGFSNAGFPVRPNINFLLFISNDNRVKGCLVAESITSASPVVLDENSVTEDDCEDKKNIWQLGNWYASFETVPAVCGINRIWVAKEYRRRKVASRMIDCLRSNFIFGHVVSLKELAFTDPTLDGRDFAAFYTGTDNFLVYK